MFTSPNLKELEFLSSPIKINNYTERFDKITNMLTNQLYLVYEPTLEISLI